MEILFNRLYKIDVDTQSAAQEQFQEHDNLDNYIMDLLEKVKEEEGDRLYKYEEGSTTIKSILDDIIQGDNYDNYSSLLARRLLQEETVAQQRYGHLYDIQKGMLIISYVRMTPTENKIIISKADYETFIEEITGQIKSGLPLKKKIFKAFVANVARSLSDFIFEKTSTFCILNSIDIVHDRVSLKLGPLLGLTINFSSI